MRSAARPAARGTERLDIGDVAVADGSADGSAEGRWLGTTVEPLDDRSGARGIYGPAKSHDHLRATHWEHPQKSVARSAILAAYWIRTPLLLITNEQDHNVPAHQAMEMFQALRRRGRKVVWAIHNDGHGMPTTTAKEVHDFHDQILAGYYEHLKGEQRGREERMRVAGGGRSP